MFLMDAEKCTGCQLCVVACKDEHVDSEYLPWTKSQPETGQFWIKVKAIERGAMPRLRVSFLPVHCQHCENAPCIKVCPDGAIKTRDDGLVWIDPVLCSGCGLCQEACPYDVIYLDEERGIAQKCTGCAHRVDEEELPRCAEVCPHDAIVFDNSYPSGKQDILENEKFYPEYLTLPRVSWKGLPQPWIAGNVIDRHLDEVLADVEITLLDLANDENIKIASDEFGDFWLRNLKKNRTYRISLTKTGYQDFVTTVTIRGDQDLGTISLQPIGA